MDPVGPALRAEGPAGSLVRDLSLGVGDRVLATVLSDLGGGRFEVRLGDRVLKVQSPQRLELGSSLALAVRQSSGRLLLEILEVRPADLAALGAADDPAHRDAARLLVSFGLPVSRESLEAVASAGLAPARRTAAFLLAAGLEPMPERLQALIGVLKGGALAEAAEALASLNLPLAREVLSLLVSDGLSAPGPEALALARSRLEEGMARLLGSDPRLAVLDRARAVLGDAPPSDPGPRAEEAVRALLEGKEPRMDEGLRREAAGLLARWEKEALSSLPGLGRLGDAHRALSRAQGEEAARILMGRDGIRYAEGTFRPGGGEAVPVRLKVAARGGKGGGGDRKEPFRVALALSLSVVGTVGAELTLDGPALLTTLRAERPEAEALLKELSPELSDSLRALGFRAEVSVARARPEELRTGFYEALGVGGGDEPLLDFKV